jgi:hypothetical protein
MMNRWATTVQLCEGCVGFEDDDADHGYPGWPTSGLQMSLATCNSDRLRALMLNQP